MKYKLLKLLVIYSMTVLVSHLSHSKEINSHENNAISINLNSVSLPDFITGFPPKLRLVSYLVVSSQHYSNIEDIRILIKRSKINYTINRRGENSFNSTLAIGYTEMEIDKEIARVVSTFGVDFPEISAEDLDIKLVVEGRNKYLSIREVVSGSAAFSLGKNGETTTDLYFTEKNGEVRDRDHQFFVPNITVVQSFQE